MSLQKSVLMVGVSASATASVASASDAIKGWKPLHANNVTRIAFGSCARQEVPQLIRSSVIAADPDLFLFVGDAIYGDVVKHDFGLLKIDSEALSGPMTRMKALGVDGQAGFEHKVALEVLQ